MYKNSFRYISIFIFLMAGQFTHAASFDEKYTLIPIDNKFLLLPRTISFKKNGENTISSQILSLQTDLNEVGYRLATTFEYNLALPTKTELDGQQLEHPISFPKTVEYSTYISVISSNGEINTELVSSGTTNISSFLVATFDIDFENEKELTDFIGSGSSIIVTTSIKYPQILSISSNFGAINQLILDYLGSNIISTEAPVLSTFNQLATDFPKLVGQNPALVLNALSGIFKKSKIIIDDNGESKLDFPSSLDIDVSSAFARPTKVRFLDIATATSSFSICDEGQVLILELGAQGCENMEKLYEKFN